MVAFDSTYLSLILNPASPPPVDASTKKPVEQAKERIDFLILTLEKQKEKILIPTPVLGEVLVLSGKSGPDYLARLERSSHFEFGDFDRRVAVEFATSVAMAKGAGDKRRMLRVARDTNAITLKQYVHIQELIDEIGRMLGGWLKSVREGSSKQSLHS